MLKFDLETTRLLDAAYQGGDAVRRRLAAYDALCLQGGDTVVDIGCGTGILTDLLARSVGPSGRVIGIDPSEDMRRLAAERCHAFSQVEIVDGVADAIPVAPESADKAVAVQVLEYLADLPATFAEAHRVLKKGGRFVAIDTAFGTLEWSSDNPDRMASMLASWDHHYAEASVASQWCRLARDAGFVGVEVKPLTFCDTALRPDSIAFMLMHLMMRYAADNGHIPEEDAQAWFDEQVARDKDGKFFFSLTYFLMSAIKP